MATKDLSKMNKKQIAAFAQDVQREDRKNKDRPAKFKVPYTVKQLASTCFLSSDPEDKKIQAALNNDDPSLEKVLKKACFFNIPPRQMIARLESSTGIAELKAEAYKFLSRHDVYSSYRRALIGFQDTVKRQTEKK